MKRLFLKICAILLIILIAAFIIASAIYLFANYPRKAEAFEFVTENSEKSFLIATQGSPFKDAFLRVLIDSLSTSPVHVKGIDLRNIGEMQDQNWDKILIINTFMAILNHDARAFIHKVQDPQKILLLVTSGGADWRPEPDLKVDAITSASHKSYIPELVDMVLIWMRSESDEQWQSADNVLSLRYFPEVDVTVACADILAKKEFYKTKYPELRRFINQAGYMFLRLNDLESARKVFKLNLVLFPDSWNVYDSYAEALLKSGDLEAAGSYYQQALKLNPQSKSAKNALIKLGFDP